MTKDRDYRKEYDNYQGRDDQKKNRASRNTARRRMEKLGRVKPGDGNDVTHRDGDPRNNESGNLGVLSSSRNRSFRRTKKAGKVGVH